MKIIIRNLFLAAMMALPLVTVAQSECTYPLGENCTEVNDSYPIDFYYTDHYFQRFQQVWCYNNGVSPLQGQTIYGLKIYCADPTANYENNNMGIRIMLKYLPEEVDNLGYEEPEFKDMTGGTVVYEGPASVSNGIIKFDFQQGFTHVGGVMLLQIENYLKAGFLYGTNAGYYGWTDPSAGSTYYPGAIYGRSNTHYPVTSGTTTAFNPQFTFIYGTRYTVTAQSSDPDMGSVEGGGYYFAGQTATLTAEPNPGYKFVKWQDNSTENPRHITVSGDATYIATFKSTVSIDNADECNVVLAPNPATGSANVILNGINGEVRIEMVDMSGRIVTSQISNGNETATIDLNGIAPGIYMVRIIAPDGNITVKKLVVK